MSGHVSSKELADKLRECLEAAKGFGNSTFAPVPFGTLQQLIELLAPAPVLGSALHSNKRGGQARRASDSLCEVTPEELQVLIETYSFQKPTALSIHQTRVLQALLELKRLRDTAHCLGELLAVAHRDGGHYQAEHGDEKATNDAIAHIYALRQRIEEQSHGKSHN